MSRRQSPPDSTEPPIVPPANGGPNKVPRTPRDRRVKPAETAKKPAQMKGSGPDAPAVFEELPWPTTDQGGGRRRPAPPRNPSLPPAAKPARRTRPAPGTDGGRSVRTRSEPVRSPLDGVPSLVSGERFGVSSGRRASAARVIAAGLICFGLWTLFDANQLYHNALSSPFGTRRTVAIEILRPVAALMNAVGISGPVSAADSALGRNGPATNSTLPPLPPPPAFQRPRALNNADEWGVAPAPHYGGLKAPPATRYVWPPALPQPTKAHPLVILDIGDSIGQDLGFGLGDVFSNDPYVRVIQKGYESTGLARPDYYNWPAVLEAYLRQYHPGVVVMMMGANDDQALSVPGGAGVPTGTAQWNRIYRSRINLVMAEASAAGAHVLWVGLPPVQNAAVTPAFAMHINQMAQQLAATTPGVTYYSSWSLLSGPGGKFVQYKKIDGNILQIRYSDGVHLAPSGWDLLASALLAPMHNAWHVNLHAAPLMKVP
ncbi:MAG: DUF459 domain-containing protein [Acidimicrobiales bacterium]